LKVKIRLYEFFRYEVIENKQYLKDKKKVIQQIKNKSRFNERLDTITSALQTDSGYSLDPSFAFHYLKGQKTPNTRGDVHILPDLVLIFGYNRAEHYVAFEYLTNHANMKEKYRLKEYMASSQEELLRRNLLQISIWKELTNRGVVEKNDMDIFYELATYFNTFRDENGHDATLEDVLSIF